MGVLEGSGLFTGVIDSFTLLETKFEKGQYGPESKSKEKNELERIDLLDSMLITRGSIRR